MAAFQYTSVHGWRFSFLFVY